MASFVDLTHTLSSGQPSYPSDPELRIRRVHTLASAGYNVAEISFSTHQGTHLDAPYPFFDNGPTVDAIPLERLCGRAALVDLAPGSALAPHTIINPAMLAGHAGAFAAGARVICRTGWDRRWGAPDYYSAHPSFTLETARWIASRGIALLGLDAPSPSVDDLEVHRVLLGRSAQIVLVESLCHLDRLPPRFTLICLPLRLAGCDGSPVRAVAWLDQQR